MNMSEYLCKAVLNEVLRNTNYTPPSTVYLALYTSNPTAADTGTEVSGGGYARQAVTFAAPTVVNGKQTVRNNAEVVFPVATADWGLITHAGIRDAATGGNLLYFAELANPRTILNGDRFRALVNTISVTQA
ncbi:hypothetical protein PACILC2_22910 [Paenibacillus cisolokensis]|uniref:Uncharacterized protein n=1 Tax=Paenibacillus cisolokensis TaxID=1658519 RepID=A0ABQ4N686_9BACL|nr:hypothetical protein [Paenibacillus cisolokensis]GIQ63723.1 hypothetical protein PACILC2_22910 [Paenibacillus cisolokensis]